LSPFNLKGVVFDLDATLVNLGEHVRWREAQGSVIEAYRACGCSEDDLARCNAKGLFNFMHDMDKRLSTTRSEEEMQAIRDDIWGVLDDYEAEGIERCSFMPGTFETLSWLRNKGIRIGVCTSNSSKVAVKVLEKLGVLTLFDSVIGRTSRMLMKPHPDQVLACFKEMGIDPCDGVMIGDSHNDVLAGKAAGAKAIGIPVYFTYKEAMEAAKPDAVVNSMTDLPEALMRLR